MTLRCKKCHGTLWIPLTQLKARSARAECPQCGHSYKISARRKLSGAGRSLPSRARQVARENRIDLPGAYSVLLDLMTVREVRDLSRVEPAGASATRQNAASAAAATDDFLDGTHDEAFQEAIDAGFMTVLQARERGSREVYARSLSRRHGLSTASALDVADNKISLLDALRERKSTSETTGVELRSGGSALRTGILVAALVATGIAATYLAPELKMREAGEWKRTYGDSTVQANNRGRIVTVSGPDPRSVLRAYCDAASDYGRLEPMGVAPDRGSGRASRLGLFRSPHRPDELLAISIVEDPRVGLWVAGDGERELVPQAAPAGVAKLVRDG